MSFNTPLFDASIALENGSLSYRLEDKVITFLASDIRFIGEFSTEPGTHAGEYFFAFIVEGFAKPVDVPAYADGIFMVLAQLKSCLGSLGNPRLQISSGFDSNILYPGQFEGQPLYEFRMQKRPLFNLPLLRHLGQIESVDKILNPELRAV